MYPPSSQVRGRNLVVLCTRFLQHCTKLCVHQWVFQSEIWAIRFRRNLGIAKLHHQESIHHWQSDRIFHLLLRLDQSSMGMCSPQLLCPGSSSPIQTASIYWWHWHPNLQVKMSLRKCRKFVPNLRVIQQNSCHHSNHRNSSHRDPVGKDSPRPALRSPPGSKEPRTRGFWVSTGGRCLFLAHPTYGIKWSTSQDT